MAVHTETNADDIKTLLKQNTELTEAVEKLTRELQEKVLGVPADVASGDGGRVD